VVDGPVLKMRIARTKMDSNPKIGRTGSSCSQKKSDEEAVIKLQALVRGFLARRKVDRYVNALIEDMMRKMGGDKAAEEERRRKEEEEELRKKEEEEAKRRREEEEELRKKKEAKELRRKEEEDERRRKEEEEEEERHRRQEEVVRCRKELQYDERQGLPLWWMEYVPHDTLYQEDYEAEIKKDSANNPLGVTIIEYRLAPGYENKKSEPLPAVPEEDDDNNANLDKILSPKLIKTKMKGSFFSCMCMDAVEEVEAFGGKGDGNTDDSNVVCDIYDADKIGADDKEDTESSAPMANDLTSDVKIVVEQ